MNFADIMTKVTEGLGVAAANVDTAVSNYKTAKGTPEKAVAVADSLLTVLEELAKFGL